MTTGSMIVVDRARLLAELRRAKEREISDHAKAQDAYPKAIADWNANAATKLHALADRLNGKAVKGFSAGYHGYAQVPVSLGEVPRKPRLDTCYIDRMIRVVELTAADTFKLRTDDPMFKVVLPDRC